VDDSNIRDEVWRTVQAMNRAWTVDRDPARLREFFHRDMIAVTATDRQPLLGRDACVGSWARFVDAARVTRWVELHPKVQVYCAGDAAVVSYGFEIAFEMAGRVVELIGRDTFTLIRENGRWWIVLDHFSPVPG
jgi:ketosteroid isomerase-like protein